MENSSLSNLERKYSGPYFTIRKRQSAKDDPSLLPCVTVADIKKERFYTTGHRQEENGKIKYFTMRTNGIDYTTKVLPWNHQIE